MAGGFYGGNVLLWDVKTGSQVNKLEGHSSNVTDVAFSTDGSILRTESYNEVFYWDVKTGRRLEELSNNTVSFRGKKFYKNIKVYSLPNAIILEVINYRHFVPQVIKELLRSLLKRKDGWICNSEYCFCPLGEGFTKDIKEIEMLLDEKE